MSVVIVAKPQFMRQKKRGRRWVHAPFCDSPQPLKHVGEGWLWPAVRDIAQSNKVKATVRDSSQTGVAHYLSNHTRRNSGTRTTPVGNRRGVAGRVSLSPVTASVFRRRTKGGQSTMPTKGNMWSLDVAYTAFDADALCRRLRIFFVGGMGVGSDPGDGVVHVSKMAWATRGARTLL